MVHSRFYISVNIFVYVSETLRIGTSTKSSPPDRPQSLEFLFVTCYILVYETLIFLSLNKILGHVNNDKKLL